MDRYNFAAGPAALPSPVLEAAKAGLSNWKGSGQSVMEIPFTGDEFAEIHQEALSSLRLLLNIPTDYHILFLQGGAYGQFSMLPMNLLRGKGRADYVVTGHWSRRAADEARKYCSVNIAASGSASRYADIPDWADWSLDPQAAYCHITTNETADGVQFSALPNTGQVPLVADVTSDFLTQPVDIKLFGALYASAQKNAGTAGLTVVIIKERLLGQPLPITPAVFDYTRLAKHASKVNTPPVWSVFIAGLMFKWIQSEGGLEEMAVRNRRKAAMLYEVIDESGLYRCAVAEKVRSSVNVCFHLPDQDLENAFLFSAQQRGLLNLKGHSASGGIRASLYNAVSEEAVAALAVFMRDFAAENSRASNYLRDDNV
jgi:phosphoserine aminotransferase